jgi:D-alanyl-D-alanine carboxypeptidase
VTEPYGRVLVLTLMLSLLGAACATTEQEDDPASTPSTAPQPVPSTTAAPSPTAPAPTTTAAPATATGAEPAPEPTTTSAAAPTTTTAAATSTTVGEPVFAFTSAELTPELIERIEPTSWRPGCPVGLSELRYLQLSYWGFDDAPHVGELIVHRDAVDAMADVFGTLFAERFPIRSMRLVDDFGGDDFTSIEADNTSAFNCRPVSGSDTGWSQHAYGTAIDINPIENPYVSGGETEHPASVPYLDRTDVRPGMIVEGGMVVAAFDRHGWGWGGRWNNLKDWQHFSASGG